MRIQFRPAKLNRQCSLAGALPKRSPVLGTHTLGGVRRHHRSRWRLSPWGLILTVALVVLVVFAIVDLSKYVVIGLIAVVFVWGVLLSSSFPSSRMTMTSRFPGAGEDLGREAAEEYERERGYR
jgi:hypothetical protein